MSLTFVTALHRSFQSCRRRCVDLPVPLLSISAAAAALRPFPTLVLVWEVTFCLIFLAASASTHPLPSSQEDCCGVSLTPVLALLVS